MSVHIRCTSCKKKLSIPETGLGKKIRCPACQTVFVATAESASQSDMPAKVATTATRAGKPPPLPPRPAPDDDVDDEERPAQRKGRKAEPEPFPAIKFRVVVKNKNDIIKKGNYAAILDEEGLIIKRKKPGDLDVPVGTRVDYDGKNNMTIELDDEPIKVQVARFRTYQNRFTESIADFLNGDAPDVYVEDYEIPWYMFILVMLPWGVPLITLGGLLPILIGAGVSGANFAIISQENWKPGVRITVAAILTGLAYLAVVLLFVLVLRAQMQRGF